MYVFSVHKEFELSIWFNTLLQSMINQYRTSLDYRTISPTHRRRSDWRERWSSQAANKARCADDDGGWGVGLEGNFKKSCSTNLKRTRTIIKYKKSYYINNNASYEATTLWLNYLFIFRIPNQSIQVKSDYHMPTTGILLHSRIQFG
jgi:hypothetical protein